MKRIVVFAKGNLDLRDSLHSLRSGGEVLWNGINAALRDSHPGVTARVRHETYNRADALMAAGGETPAALEARRPELGSYPAASQFSTAVFDAAADVTVLSVQPEISTGLMRHRREGWLFHASEMQRWPPELRAWLREEFELSPPPATDVCLDNLRQVVARLQQRSAAPILVYNVSPVVPGETVHCLMGLGETFATRVRRLNLGLAELSEETGISIVDVDQVVARAGADRVKVDALHLTPEGNRLVAEEAVRILEDLGVLAE